MGHGGRRSDASRGDLRVEVRLLACGEGGGLADRERVEQGLVTVRSGEEGQGWDIRPEARGEGRAQRSPGTSLQRAGGQNRHSPSGYQGGKGQKTERLEGGEP
jgi:hypothetical protein